MNFNDWAEKVYKVATEKGFHDGDESTPEVDRVAKYVANLHGEVSELWEACRTNSLRSLCDKASKMTSPLSCVEEELADIIIRALDTAHGLGVNIQHAIEIKNEFNETRPIKHGGKLA